MNKRDTSHWFLPLPSSQCDAMETHSGDNICNTTEAQLVSKIVNILIEGGVPSDDIGVITPYRQQQKFIRETLKEELPQAQNIVSVTTPQVSNDRDYKCADIITVVSSFASFIVPRGLAMNSLIPRLHSPAFYCTGDKKLGSGVWERG